MLFSATCSPQNLVRKKYILCKQGWKIFLIEFLPFCRVRVLMVDSNSGCAHMKENSPFRRKNPICDCSRSNQLQITDQVTVRNYSELPSNIPCFDRGLHHFHVHLFMCILKRPRLLTNMETDSQLVLQINRLMDRHRNYKCP